MIQKMSSPFLDSDYQQGTVCAHQPAAQEQENKGGFDCEFVERPPEELRKASTFLKVAFNVGDLYRKQLPQLLRRLLLH